MRHEKMKILEKIRGKDAIAIGQFSDGLDIALFEVSDGILEMPSMMRDENGQIIGARGLARIKP